MRNTARIRKKLRRAGKPDARARHYFIKRVLKRGARIASPSVFNERYSAIKARINDAPARPDNRKSIYDNRRLAKISFALPI